MNVAEIKNGDELKDLYRELILDHSRNPRHFGKLAEATHVADGINPLCGDKLRLYMQLGSDDNVAAATFEGTGCAISVASASLLTEMVIGKSRSEALQLFRAITDRLTDSTTSDTADIDIGKIRALDGVREFPSRVKCATLAWHALNSAFNKHESPASTE